MAYNFRYPGIPAFHAAQLSCKIHRYLELATNSFTRWLKEEVVTGYSALCSCVFLPAPLVLVIVSQQFNKIKRQVSTEYKLFQLNASNDHFFLCSCIQLMHLFLEKAILIAKVLYIKKLSSQLPDNSLRHFWSRPKQISLLWKSSS